MRLHRRTVTLLAAVGLVVSALPAYAVYRAQPTDHKLAPWLQGHLRVVADTTPVRVMVSGRDQGDAVRALELSGLGLQQSWDLVGIAVGIGTPAQVRRIAAQPGVRYVEGDQPLTYTLDAAHKATRSDIARATLRATGNKLVDGAGITVAVIDSGIDGLHPFFQSGGASTVVQNRKNVCRRDLGLAPASSDGCFVALPDADSASIGGHGTHVAGIVAGIPLKTTGTSPKAIRGAASGAKLVGLSVGAAISLIDSAAAQNWVLEHQFRPCRSRTEQNGPLEPACPPIRVTNHSYGPSASSSGNRFNEGAASVTLQRALVKRGVVAVWAAGNDAGTGAKAFTNPPGMDPTPGILMVASYNDGGTGNRDNRLSSFSSRGQEGEPMTYPDISAPGDRILSSCRPYLAICSTGRAPVDGPGPADVATFNSISGTSMAAPYVAGVVAQLFQANPRLRPADVERILEDTAHRFTAGADYERDDPSLNRRTPTSFDKGHGLVDVNAALKLALRAR